MDPKIIDYYIIDCSKPSKIGIEYRYNIGFNNPGIMTYYQKKMNTVTLRSRSSCFKSCKI